VEQLAASEFAAALRKLKNPIDFFAHLRASFMPPVAVVASALMIAVVVVRSGTEATAKPALQTKVVALFSVSHAKTSKQFHRNGASHIFPARTKQARRLGLDHSQPGEAGQSRHAAASVNH
jgi:hypothetical protein